MTGFQDLISYRSESKTRFLDFRYWSTSSCLSVSLSVVVRHTTHNNDDRRKHETPSNTTRPHKRTHPAQTATPLPCTDRDDPRPHKHKQTTCNFPHSNNITTTTITTATTVPCVTCLPGWGCSSSKSAFGARISNPSRLTTQLDPIEMEANGDIAVG